MSNKKLESFIEDFSKSDKIIETIRTDINIGSRNIGYIIMSNGKLNNEKYIQEFKNASDEISKNLGILESYGDKGIEEYSNLINEWINISNIIFISAILIFAMVLSIYVSSKVTKGIVSPVKEISEAAKNYLRES